MAPSDILVFLDEFEHTADRLQVAADLAATHGSILIGLRVEVQPRIPRALRGAIVDQALTAHQAALRAASDRLEALFRQEVAARGLQGEWWRVADGAMADVVERARYASLAVVSQHDPQDDEEFSADDLIHDLLLGAGRPVLIVPKWPVRGTVGQRAVVAWNSSREASRALADALPLLVKAERVTVMIAPDDHAEAIGERLVAHLARHGVAATPKILEDHPDKSPGVAILQECNAIEANLLVMGGYGRSRLHEKVFGGMTEFVLGVARLPVLMAH
jgi:nucleotide-binding universal stress UspA family protein